MHKFYCNVIISARLFLFLSCSLIIVASSAGFDVSRTMAIFLLLVMCGGGIAVAGMVLVSILEVVVFYIDRHQGTRRNRFREVTRQRNAAVAEVKRLREKLGAPISRNDDPWRAGR